MIARQRVMMIGGTILCALGVGYFVQHGESPRANAAGFTPGIAQLSVVAPSGELDTLDGARLDLQAITLTSAQPAAPVRLPVPASSDLAPGSARSGADAAARGPDDPASPVLGCDVAARAEPADMASVHLTVTAPCLGNERVTIHHSGMMFTAVTDLDGRLDLTIPALADNAVFIAAFANGNGAVATTRIDDLKDYDRIALQWSGPGGFQIHALEFGAAYGEPGHVWSGAQPVNGSSVVRLGSPDTLAPQMVEVYTYPAGTSAASGTVALSVETEVTQQNCSRDIAAQTLELRDNGQLRTRDLVLSVPGCDAAGDFLVLNNVLEDLKIAAR